MFFNINKNIVNNISYMKELIKIPLNYLYMFNQISTQKNNHDPLFALNKVVCWACISHSIYNHYATMPSNGLI